MTLRSFLLSLLLILPFAFAATAAEKKSAYDRVMETGTIRCGYATWPPSIVKDPNTGAMSGYSVDVINAVAEKLGLKIEWTEETGWGIAEEGLANGRFDVMCADVCFNAIRTKGVWYSTPFIHAPNYAFVRANDQRFDKDRAKLNDPSLKIAIIPNTTLDYAAKETFPLTQRLDVNDLSGNTDVIMAVVTRKADASINNLYSIEQFNKNNAQAIKPVGEPVRYCHGGFLLPQGDMKFKYMIDSAIQELAYSDQLRGIFQKYMPDNGKHWRVPAKPYETDRQESVK